MLLRLLFVLPALLFCTFQSLAQAYEPGLLVTSTGDTLRGEIENSFWVEPPAFVRYRAASAASSQMFQPRQLRAVSFTDGRYFKYEALPLDRAVQTELDKLPRGNYPAIRVDTVLAEVLLDGPVPLRRVVLDGTPHYLLWRPNQPVLELSERRYLRETENDLWSVADGNNYLAQLSLYFLDCPEAASAARLAPFTAEGLADVVQAFNQACGSEHKPAQSWLAQAKPRRRLSFQGGVLAGVRYNRIESTSHQLAGPCVDCRPQPFAGLYAELFQPSRTVAVYGELSLSSFRSKVTYDVNFAPPSGFTYSTYDYKGLLGTARVGLRSFMPLGRENQLLMGFGYELNRLLRSSVVPGNGPARPFLDYKLGFGVPTLLPGLELGWRNRRLSFMLDGKLYGNVNYEGISSLFFGSNYIVRTSVSYRLGRNPDAQGLSKIGKP